MFQHRKFGLVKQFLYLIKKLQVFSHIPVNSCAPGPKHIQVPLH